MDAKNNCNDDPGKQGEQITDQRNMIPIALQYKGVKAPR